MISTSRKIQAKELNDLESMFKIFKNESTVKQPNPGVKVSLDFIDPNKRKNLSKDYKIFNLRSNSLRQIPKFGTLSSRVVSEDITWNDKNYIFRQKKKETMNTIPTGKSNLNKEIKLKNNNNITVDIVNEAKENKEKEDSMLITTTKNPEETNKPKDLNSLYDEFISQVNQNYSYKLFFNYRIQYKNYYLIKI